MFKKLCNYMVTIYTCSVDVRYLKKIKHPLRSFKIYIFWWKVIFSASLDSELELCLSRKMLSWRLKDFFLCPPRNFNAFWCSIVLHRITFSIVWKFFMVLFSNPNPLAAKLLFYPQFRNRAKIELTHLASLSNFY